MIESTTIRISIKNREKLDELKEHHRETYNDVLDRLLKQKIKSQHIIR